MTLEEEILHLTNIWYRYVGMDHHKDRDCHFYVEKIWSYGDEPYYRASHPGYVMGNWESPKVGSEELAMILLRDKLINEIKSSIMSIQMDIDYLDSKGIDHEWILNKEDLLNKIAILEKTQNN